MADDYTPTMEKLRMAWIASRWESAGQLRSEGSDDEFDRAIAAHDAEKRAEWEAEQGEVEWEYGVGWEYLGRTFGFRMADRLSAESHIAQNPHEDEDFGPSYLVRRTKDVPAGEWVPVNENS